VSLFSLDLIFLMMSYLIFFVAVILSMIWRFVIYFFSIFLFVLSFKVCMVLLNYLICPIVAMLSYQPSFFFNRAIYPFFLLISRTFIAFCYSIYIMALRSWILSLKFSKICSLIVFISSFSSILPQYEHIPSVPTELFFPCRLYILGNFYLFSIFYLF